MLARNPSIIVFAHSTSEDMVIHICRDGTFTKNFCAKDDPFYIVPNQIYKLSDALNKIIQISTNKIVGVGWSNEFDGWNIVMDSDKIDIRYKVNNYSTLKVRTRYLSDENRIEVTETPLNRNVIRLY